jgi:hypothetical protein
MKSALRIVSSFQATHHAPFQEAEDLRASRAFGEPLIERFVMNCPTPYLCHQTYFSKFRSIRLLDPFSITLTPAGHPGPA